MAIPEEKQGNWQQQQHRRRQTYAQVLRAQLRRSRSPPPPRFIRAPNSPTTLMFPPSHEDLEWDNRCFRCFRKGHAKGFCTFPTRCAICWGQGHEFRQCPTKKGARHTKHQHHARRQETAGRPNLPRPEAPPKQKEQEVVIKPTDPAYPIRKMNRREPGFQDLMKEDAPHRGALPDSDRGSAMKSFITRDQDFFQRVEELHSAVVVSIPVELIEHTTPESVAQTFIQEAGGGNDKIEVFKLSPSSFLVKSKAGGDMAVLAAKLSEEWWTQGFKAERWSPLTGAGVQGLGFKAWVEFVGLPPHLRKKAYILQAVTQFGVFLGNIPSKEPSDISSWGVAVATADLRSITPEVTFSAGALEYKIKVEVRRWCSGQVYSALDFPKLPEKILPPSARSPVLDFKGDSLTIKMDDLRKIFRHVPTEDLPSDIRIAMAQQETQEADRKGKKVVQREQVVELLRRDLTVINKTTKPAEKEKVHAGGSTTGATKDPVGKTPHKIGKRGREGQSASSARLEPEPTGKRTFRAADRAAQVLIPFSFLSSSLSYDLGEKGVGDLFPEAAGLELISDPKERVPPVGGTDSGELELGREEIETAQEDNISQTQLVSGPVCSQGGEGIHVENVLQIETQIGVDSEAGPSEPNISTKPQDNRPNKLIKKSVGRPKNKNKKTSESKDECRVASVNEADFISVPLVYQESLNMASLIGVPSSQVPSEMGKGNSANASDVENRIKSRAPTRSDINRVPSPLKERGTNTCFVQQMVARGRTSGRDREARKNALVKEKCSRAEEIDEGSAIGNSKTDSEEEVDYEISP